MTLTPAVRPGLRTSPKRTCQLGTEEKTKTVPPHAPQAGAGPPRNKPPYYKITLRGRRLLRLHVDAARRKLPPWRSLRGGPAGGASALPPILRTVLCFRPSRLPLVVVLLFPSLLPPVLRMPRVPRRRPTKVERPRRMALGCFATLRFVLLLFRERVPLRPDNHQSGVFILTTRRAENNRSAQRNTQAVPVPPPHPRLVTFSSADGRFASRSTNSVSRQESSKKQIELCRSALSRIFSA